MPPPVDSLETIRRIRALPKVQQVIVSMMLNGHSAAAMSDYLTTSKEIVRWHRRKIMESLGVKSLVEFHELLRQIPFGMMDDW